MEEKKCKECGAILAADAKECSVCGCPVDIAEGKPIEVKGEPAAQSVKTEETKAKAIGMMKEKKSIKINFMAIISLILGIVIIAMGAKVSKMKMDVDVEAATYSAKHYDVDYAAFGGDFYTEIYGATDTIVDELDDINSGVATLTKSVASASDTMANTLANTIYYPVGMLIIALGIGVVAVSCIHILKVD